MKMVITLNVNILINKIIVGQMLVRRLVMSSNLTKRVRLIKLGDDNKLLSDSSVLFSHLWQQLNSHGDR